jgi:hypothetical protein
MDSRTNNTYRMMTTVASTIESNKSLKAVTDLPALLKAQTDLSATNSQIAELLETIATPAGPSPETTVKTNLATDAVESCAELAAAVHAYAVDHSDQELAAKSNYSESSLGSGTESEIIAKCTKVVSLAAEVADELDDHGYTAQDVTAIGKTVEAFAKSCPKPRQGVASRSSANKEIEKLIRKGRRIVTARIDKLALQLRKTAPAFYQEYKTARKVLSQPTAQPGGESSASGLSVTSEVKKAA